MKTIILAGGFAKRMWPLTKDKPKHLLDVAGRPMLSYVIEKVGRCKQADVVYVSTNAKFKPDFEKFLSGLKTRLDIRLIIEDSKHEGEKLGSIGALEKIVREEDINDETLILGGDNLFGFEFQELYDYFKRKDADAIAVYDLGSFENASRYGIVRLDENDLITEFLEKPEKPPTTLTATACYLLRAETARSLTDYIRGGNNPDAMGFFITWLYKRKPVYAYRFKGEWFDIGSLDTLKEADEFYQRTPPKGF
jgi:glucose-1-phosphate thymidylyltransferase